MAISDKYRLPRGIVRGQGQGANRKDDIARTGPGWPMTSDVMTKDGSSTPVVSQELWNALTYATRSGAFFMTISTAAVLLSWGDYTTVGIECINDSPNSVGISFGGTNAVVPLSTGSVPTFQSSHLVRPGEIRSFAIHTKFASVIAAAPASDVRVTLLLPV